MTYSPLQTLHRPQKDISSSLCFKATNTQIASQVILKWKEIYLEWTGYHGLYFSTTIGYTVALFILLTDYCQAPKV